MDNPFSPQHQRDTRGNPGTRPEAGAAWCRCPHSRAVFEQIFSHIPFVVAAVVLLLLTRVQPPTRRVFCNPAALPVVARRRGFDALGKLSGVIQLPLPVRSCTAATHIQAAGMAGCARHPPALPAAIQPLFRSCVAGI